MGFAEGPQNWLSKVIDEKCKSIDRLIPFVERRAERDAIVEAIKIHPKGAPLAANKDLAEVVHGALGVYNRCAREAKNKPDVMTASPAVQASWFVFEELGLPLPDAE